MTILRNTDSSYNTPKTRVFGPHGGEQIGVCEYHNAANGRLTLVRLHPLIADAEDASPSLRGPIYICTGCQQILRDCWKLVTIRTIETNMRIADITNDRHHARMIDVLLDLRDKISEIKDIFVLPDENLDKEYHGDLNILFEFRILSVLSYAAWAQSQKKCVLHLWNTAINRNRFWPSKMTRLLIALGRMNKDTEGLNIWIRTYGRVFHIDYFCSTPIVIGKVIPKTLIKLDR